MYVCMYECMYVCMYVYMYVCMYVCMYVGMLLCMYVYMYECMYVCMNLCFIDFKWKLVPTTCTSQFRTSETGKIASFLLVNQFLLGLISSHLFKKMLIYNFYRDLFLFIN